MRRLFCIRQKFVKNKLPKGVKTCILIVTLICHKWHNNYILLELAIIVSLNSTLCYNIIIAKERLVKRDLYKFVKNSSKIF